MVSGFFANRWGRADFSASTQATATRYSVTFTLKTDAERSAQCARRATFRPLAIRSTTIAIPAIGPLKTRSTFAF